MSAKRTVFTRTAAVAAVGLMVAAMAVAVEVPQAVSPGGSARLVRVADVCPTFSWTAAPGAVRYELVIYAVGEREGESVEVLRQVVPGGATSWSPSLATCLERGGRYAWSVRAVSGKSATEWSAPSLLEVVAGPSGAEFETALEVVKSYLAIERAGGESVASAEESSVEEEPRRPAARAVSDALADPVGTQLSVEGNVAATSFSGDGSLVTNLAPGNLSSGTAAIDVSGTAANVTGTVAVSNGGTGATDAAGARTNLGAASAADLATHVVSAAHDDRYYTEGELQGDGTAAVHWNNLTDVPANVADTTSGDAVAGELASGKKAWVDGAEVTGTLLRFQDNGDGTVTDRHSGRIWLKDASCAALAGTDSQGKANWATAVAAAAALASGTCGLTDGSSASDWSLPAILTLASLIDKGHGAPTISNAAGTGPWSEGDAFVGVQSDFYWSATELSAGFAQLALLNPGIVLDDAKANAYYVWPVRSVE